jgi:hypothetical protein
MWYICNRGNGDVRKEYYHYIRKSTGTWVTIPGADPKNTTGKSSPPDDPGPGFRFKIFGSKRTRLGEEDPYCTLEDFEDCIEP